MRNKLVTIATFVNSLEASMAQQILQAENIPAFIMDDTTVSWAWHLSTAVGWIKLKVRQSDLDEAIDILTAYQIEVSSTVQEELAEENQTLTDNLDKDNQDENAHISTCDRLLNYAFRAAIIGLFGFPLVLLQLYSLSVLIYLIFKNLDFAIDHAGKFLFTLMLNLIAFYFMSLFISAILG